MTKPKFCYGCRYLHSKFWACGGTSYDCTLPSGLRKGWVAAYEPEDDEPMACEKFEKEA